MTKPDINTFDELLAEKARLKALLQVQTEQIKDDFKGIKEELKPLTNITAAAGMFFSRKASSALGGLGMNLVIDGFIKKVLLGNAGWITRFIVPLLLKNYASHWADKPGKLISKIKHLFGKNGKSTQEAGIDAV